MKKTAVEWLVEQWTILESQLPPQLIEKAKEMEKSNIEQSFNHGRNVGRDGSPGVDGNYYYKKTFKEE